MSNAPATRHILGAAIAAVLALATGADAMAQQTRGSDERRARTSSREQARPEARFPESSRKEPGLRASPRLNDDLNRLFKHYEAEDAAAARAIADKVIADSRANAYERALAARIAGSMLIGTDDAQAQAYLQQAVDANGLSNNEHFESMLVVAQLQMQNEQFRESISTLDAFLAGSGSTDPEHQVLKANALFRLEQYPEAIAVLKPVVEGSPEPRPEWTQLLLAAYSEAGQADEASRVAERIAATTPADKRAQLNLAATYIQTGQDDKALAVYEQLRTSGQLSEDREYRNMYALYLGGEGKEQQAIDVINEGLEKGILKPDHQAYVALAQAYFFSERPAEAIEAYQKAAPLAPDGETHLNLAKVLANEGRDAESKAAAQQALDKGVKNPDDARRLLSR